MYALLPQTVRYGEFLIRLEWVALSHGNTVCTKPYDRSNIRIIDGEGSGDPGWEQWRGHFTNKRCFLMVCGIYICANTEGLQNKFHACSRPTCKDTGLKKDLKEKNKVVLSSWGNSLWHRGASITVSAESNGGSWVDSKVPVPVDNHREVGAHSFYRDHENCFFLKAF